MSGPVFSRRDAQPLDLLLKQAGGDGFKGIEKLMKPVFERQPLQPSDEVARTLARLVSYQGGREVIEWMMDISVRQPFRTKGETLEAVAMHAKQKEAIDGFAAVLLAAIAHGQTLLEE